VVASVFGPTAYSIAPSPCPLAGPVTVTHATLELAVHAHSRAALTPIRPVPPDAGTLKSVAASVTPQRGTVAGAVDVVDEEPHAAARMARVTTTSEARTYIVSMEG
jgi:hypothetical protein